MKENLIYLGVGLSYSGSFALLGYGIGIGNPLVSAVGLAWFFGLGLGLMASEI